MEKLGREATLEARQSFSGTTELVLKKRALDKGKAVCDEQSKTNTNLDQELSLSLSKLPSTTLALGMADQQAQKYEPNPNYKRTFKKAELEPSFNMFLNPKEGQVGESSKHALTQPLPSRPPIICKFCGQQFSTTQALGGHQNAHKQEREMQKVMKAAQEFEKSPYMYNFLGIRPPFFPGPYYGYHFQNPSYPGYAPKGWNPRLSTSLGLGSPSVEQNLEGFVRPSIMRPMGAEYNFGWSKPHGQSSGPIIGPQGSPKFHSHTASNNITKFLQGMKNEATPNKKLCVESLGHELSRKRNDYASSDLLPSKSNEFIELEKAETQNESTELDLTLKL